MGIVNTTPDSFSDAGLYLDSRAAIAHAQLLIDEGADLLDIGAESTRPGSLGVSAQEEWARLAPVLTELVTWGVPISVDTMKPEVMRQAAALGVDILNDVYGFQAAGAAQVLVDYPTLGAVVMHMQGEPRMMQQAPVYSDVCEEVQHFLQARLETLGALGVDPRRVLVDPGFGFGKTLEHNLALIKATRRFAPMAAGVLIGVSRKSMIGQLTGRSLPSERVFGSLAAALYAAGQGARVVRVHDVKATADAFKVWGALSA